MLMTYTQDAFPESYIPTVYDNYSANVKLNNKPYLLCLWDTAGQEEYDRTRPEVYPGADIFLVCFSVVGPASANNIRVKWQPEVRQHCPKVPMILVGTQIDLREDEKTVNELKIKGEEPVTHSQVLLLLHTR